MSSDGTRDERALWGLFYRGTNLIHEGPTLIIWSSPRCSLPNTITLGIRFQHRNIGENTNIKSVKLVTDNIHKATSPGIVTCLEIVIMAASGSVSQAPTVRPSARGCSLSSLHIPLGLSDVWLPGPTVTQGENCKDQFLKCYFFL